MYPVTEEKKVEEEKSLTAVGVHVYAGGFTLGVMRHFDVDHHLEDGDFAADTIENNLPAIMVHQSPEEWPVDRLKGVNFVYANPPCAPWSPARRGEGEEIAHDWRDDERLACVAQVVDLLPKLLPDALCFESVRGVYTKGRELIDRITKDAAALGYRATYVLCDALEHGVPQSRPRVFVLLSRWEVPWEATGEPRRVVRDVLTDETSGGPVANWLEGYFHYYDEVRPGESMRDGWERLNSRKKRSHEAAKKRGEDVGKLKGRPSFLFRKLDLDKPCPTLTGNPTKIHPEERRWMTLREYAAMSGFPPDFEFMSKGVTAKYAQVAKGVMPPVAEYLARMVAKAIRARVPATVERPEEVWVYSSHVVRKEPSPAKRLTDEVDAVPLWEALDALEDGRGEAPGRLLEVGCGGDAPGLAWLSHQPQGLGLYVGVDAGPLGTYDVARSGRVRMYGSFDFGRDARHLTRFQFGTDFDVVASRRALSPAELKNARDLLRPDGEPGIVAPRECAGHAEEAELRVEAEHDGFVLLVRAGQHDVQPAFMRRSLKSAGFKMKSRRRA